MASEGNAAGRSAGVAYALVTLVGAAIAIAIVGAERDRVWGIGAAWLIQAGAFWRLDRALQAPRNATGAWIGGMFARGGGLVVTGLLAFGGWASADLPIAYGIAMLALLLLEAAWLSRRVIRPPGEAAEAADVNELDRTRSTG